MGKEPHVADVLAKELETRGWSLMDCVEWMGVDAGLETQLVKVFLRRIPGIHLHPETAAGLERALGVSAQTWLNRDAAWQKENRPIVGGPLVREFDRLRKHIKQVESILTVKQLKQLAAMNREDTDGQESHQP